jgi:phage gpG-like protein
MSRGGLAIDITDSSSPLQKSLERIGDAGATAMPRALKRGAQELVKSWKHKLSLGRSRKTLGVVTGHLRRSIQAGRVETAGGSRILRVGTSAPYAAIHEFGFRGTVRVKRKGGGSFSRRLTMPKRPHAKPAADDAKGKILKIFQRELAVEMKKRAD